jgi:hypothetical protein
MRFEAFTNAQLVEYMQRFDHLLDQYPQVDRTELRRQMAAFGGK